MQQKAFLTGRSILAIALLAVLWLLTAIGAVGRFVFQQAGWEVLIGLAALLFGGGLLWALSRTKPAINELPNPMVFTTRLSGFWVRTLLLFLGLALTLFLGMFIGTGFIMMVICGLLGLGVTLAWRKLLTRRVAGAGLVIGLISAMGTVFLGTHDILWAVTYLLTIPPAFTGGALLLDRTRLGQVRILECKPILALSGFLIGCVVALPAAFFNLLGNMQSQDTYIVHWWQPLYAIVPAISEETWARLFLVSFCYALLRPVTNLRPRRAIVVAILMSVLAFSTAHAGLNPFVIVIDGLLFSTPYALLLIKKDFEHAVGYHFMVDFIRFVAAFLS